MVPALVGAASLWVRGMPSTSPSRVSPGMTLRRSLAWSFSQQFWLYVLQFASMVVIARLLTPGEVGVFILAFTVHQFLGAFRELGVGAFLIREPRLTDGKIRTVFGISILLSTGIALVILALRHPLAGAFGESGVAEVLLIVAVTVFIGPLARPAQALLRREMRFDILHHVNLSTKLLGVVLAIWLAWEGFSYMALAWSMLAERVASIAMILAVERRHLRLGPSLSDWRRVVAFGGWLSAANLAGSAAAAGNKFLLGALINPAAAALFDRSNRIPGMVRAGLFRPLGQVFMPTFAKDLREGRSIGPKIEKLVGATAAVVWPAFLIIGMLAEPVVLLLFGPNWIEVATILPWLLAGQAIATCLPQPVQILVPHGRVRRLFALRLAQTVTALTIGAIAATYGLEAFAMSRPLAVGLFMVMLWITIAPFIDVAPRQLARVHAKSLICAIITAAPTTAVTLHYGAGAPVGLLIAALAAAPVLWLAAVHALHHPLRPELMRLSALRFSMLGR